MFLTRLIPSFAGLVMCASSLAAVQHVEVHLRSGAVVTGEVISDDLEKLVIKSTAVGKSGKTMSVTIPYKRSDIVKVEVLADPEEQYRLRKDAAMTAAEHLALALWCREKNLTDHAVEHAKKAVELDATQDTAVKLLSDLDWALVDGRWMRESEALAAQGKVRVQGKVMTVAEAEALKAAAQQQAAAANAEKAADDKADSLAAIDRQIEELKKRPALIEADLQKANASLTSAQGLTQKVASAKSAFDSAQQSLDQARTANQTNTRGNTGGTNLLPLTQAVETAQKALAAARREAANSENLVAQAKAKITALGNDRKAVDRKMEGLLIKRQAAVRALEQAKEAKPAETKPTEAKPAEAKPAEAKPAPDAAPKPAGAAP